MNLDFLPAMSVKELFDNEPMLIKMFMELKLDCIGCPMDDFHSLEDVAKENNLDLDHLLGKIQDILIKKGDTNEFQSKK
jgi:hybrid cluster-associated redox disulfide protein